MKKLLLALALVLAPTLAAAQCTGVFPANTLCGNLTGSPAPPSAFTASGSVVGPGTSTLNGLPKWGNTGGTSLIDAAGTTVAGAYTWSGIQTFTLAPVFTDGAGSRTALGLGTAATQATGTSGATIPFLNGINTWSATNTHSGNVRYTGSALNFYVATTGNDSNDCLTAPTACLTLNHTVNVALSYDANGATPTVNLGTGTFTGALEYNGNPRGVGITAATTYGLILNGNGSANTIVDDTSAICGTIVTSGSGTNLTLQNLTVTKSSGCAAGGSGIFAQSLSYVALGADVNFGNAGATSGQQIHVEGNAYVEATANYKITGSASAHVGLSHGGNYVMDAHTITCTGAPAFTEFITAQDGSHVVFLTGSTFSGCGSVTGSRFDVRTNSILDTEGQNASWLPGNTAGTRYANGLYLPQGTPTIGTCTNGAVTVGGDDQTFQVAFTGNNSTCSVVFAVPRAVATNCTATTNSASTAVGMGSSLDTGMSFVGTFVNTNFVNVNCPN